MKALMLFQCTVCGVRFKPGNRKSGVPNGIGIPLSNGNIYYCCADCIMDEEKNKQFCDIVNAAKEKIR